MGLRYLESLPYCVRWQFWLRMERGWPRSQGVKIYRWPIDLLQRWRHPLHLLAPNLKQPNRVTPNLRRPQFLLRQRLSRRSLPTYPYLYL
jgi:hypothetical protein